MSYQIISGNLFNTEAKALVNTVNCVGVMGKGIALEFRRRFPIMFKEYQRECEEGKYQPGQIKLYQERGKIIINCAIKDHWRNPSKMEWLESCLRNFQKEYQKNQMSSAAFPWMGAQNGRLPFDQIREKMHQYLSGLPDIDIEIYDFDPKAPDPLFRKLEKIANQNKPQKYQELIGLRKDIFNNVINAVQSKQVNSLFMLSSNKIIGERSADKLYDFLINFDPDKSPPDQLSLF